MTLPVVATLGTNATGTTSAGVTVPVPAGTANGDLLVMQVSCAKASGANTAASTINTPSGWVKIVDATVAATLTAIGDRMCIFVRIASSEPADYAVTATTGTSASDGMIGKMVRITGHRGLHIKGTALATTAGTSAAITGVTTEMDDTVALYFGSWAAAGVVTSSHSAGSEQYDFGTDPGTAISITMASLDKTTAGATGTDTVTIGSAIRVGACVTIASVPAIPTIVESGTNKTGNPSTDISSTFASDGPFLILPGDLLVAIVHAAGASTTPALATPASWTKQAESVMTSGSARGIIGFFYLVAAGSETSVTFTATPDTATNGMTVKIVRIAGHDTTTPVNVSSVTTPTNNLTTLTVDGVTTTINNCLVFYCAGGAGARTFTPSGSMTERWDFNVNPGLGSSQAVATLVQASLGATGSQSYDPNTNTTAEAVCVAIAPPPSLTQLDLSDSVALAEGLGALATLSLAEAISMAEAAGLGAVLALTETVTGADSMSLAATLGLSDTVSLTELGEPKNLVVLADTVTLAELPALLATVGLSDTVTLSEAQDIAAILDLAEAATATETLATVVTLVLTDSVTLSESQVIAAVLSLGDVVSIIEVAEPLNLVSLTDAVTLSEASDLFARVDLPDTVTVAETHAILATLALSDSVTAGEQLLISALLSLLDGVTASEALLTTVLLDLLDTATIAEAADKVVYTTGGAVDTDSWGLTN